MLGIMAVSGIGLRNRLRSSGNTLTQREEHTHMTDDKSRYRFLLIEAFHLTATAKHTTRNFLGPKEETLMNYKILKPLLDTIEWDRDPGPEASYGDWPVETREEFDIVSAARLPIVRKACESGKYNGIVLLGGGEPGFLASRLLVW